jgi:NAD(P)H dehydrogenase (quinone)
MTKKITLILGHPDSESYCSAIASAYEFAAKKAGHEIKVFRLGEIDFDPTLHKGYKQIQVLEPDLKKVQEAITWAQHLVFSPSVEWSR